MVVRARRVHARLCGVLTAAVLLAACSAESSPRPAPRPAPSSAPVTVDVPDPCTLRLAGDTVELTEAAAVELTALAARQVRADRPAAPSVAGLASRLQAAGSINTTATAAAARALLGYDGPALTCAHSRAASTEAKATRTGLTPRANRLLADLNVAFGRLPTGGYASGGVKSGHVNDSSHYDGRAIDVFFRPRSDRVQNRLGWAAAQWLVARASRLAVLSVIYRDRIWTVWASSAGWRDYVHPSGNTTNPVLRHLDHVHTAVVGGDFRRED